MNGKMDKRLYERDNWLCDQFVVTQTQVFLPYNLIKFSNLGFGAYFKCNKKEINFGRKNAILGNTWWFSKMIDAGTYIINNTYFSTGIII